MNFPIESYRALVESFYGKLTARESLADASTGDGEWTLRDMVAHLVDSFTNNHQRFVRLQLEDHLVFPAYEAEAWRSAQRIDSLDYRFVCDLWRASNIYLLAVIEGIDEACLGNVWETGEGPKTLDFLVKDYFRHLEWHVDFFERRVAKLLEAGKR
jgi:hypothetical protein